MAKHVDLDFVADPYPTIGHAALDAISRYGLSGYRVLTMHGPGGHNPLVRFYGDDEALSKLQIAYDQMAEGEWTEKEWPLPHPIAI
jgi:hypothetical protein